MTEFSIGLILLFLIIILSDKVFLPYFRHLLQSLSFNAGESLLESLLNINRFSLAEGKTIKLEKYKYFTDISENLLLLYKKLGIDIFPSFFKLRQRLKQDLVLVSKIKKVLQGAYIEIFIIMFFSWIFVFIASSYLNIQMNLLHLGCVLVWQIIGMISLNVLLKRKQMNLFDQLAKYVGVVMRLEALFNAPIAFHELMNRCQIADLNHLNQHTDLKSYIEQVLSHLKNYGSIKVESIQELSQCVEYKFDNACEDFEKYAKSLKLSILLAFFLTSYLLIILSLMSTMLI